MSLKRIFKTLAVSALFAFAAQPVSAQDLLARQAPVDRKMKAVDTLVLKKLIDRENSILPAAELYDGWDNKYAHRSSELPDSFKINLRHFCMPTPSRVITSNFGSRWGRQHKGLDIKVYIGDSIRAAFSGKVRIVRYEGGGYGNYIVIRHPNGLETIYGHLSKQLVEENQDVRAGEVIGLGGNTGRSTGSHLHFETRLCGVALNPALLFDFRAQDVTGDYYLFTKRTYERESAEATRVRGKVGNGGYRQEDVNSTMANNESNANTFNGDRLYHKVASGETLTSIAQKRGVSVETICKLNHIRKTMRVRPGQILRYS
ncbi:MAG TPA: M23 family metallopeptidase [Prevotella sp.]